MGGLLMNYHEVKQRELLKITKKIILTDEDPVISLYPSEQGHKLFLTEEALAMMFDRYDMRMIYGSIVFWEKEDGTEKSKIINIGDIPFYIRKGIFGLVKRDDLLIAKQKIRNRC